MALTGISYRPPYLPLSGATVTPISGTGFVSGTYDFMIYVADVGPSSAASRESSPIFVSGIVLNGSQGVKLDIVWDISHTVTEYAYTYLRRNTSGAGTGTWVFLQKSNGNFGGIQNPSTTYQFLTYYTYSLYPSMLGPSPFPFFNNQLGAGVIDIGDTGGVTYTMKQILDDMNTNGYLTNDYSFYNGYNTFYGCWSIKTLASATGKLNITGFYLWLYTSVFNNNNFQVYTVPSIYSTTISSYKYAGAGQYLLLYNCDFYGVTIESATMNMGSYVGTMQIGTNVNTRFTNCRLHTGYPPLYYPNTYDGTVIFCSFSIVNMDSTNYCLPLIMWGYLRLYRIDSNIFIRDSIFKQVNNQPNAGFIINAANPLFSISKYLDCEFITYTSTTNFTTLSTEDYPLRISWTGLINNYYQMCHIEHSVNFTIQDSDGNAIEDAVLTIFDKDDILVNSDTSDSLGVIPEIKIITKKIQYIQGAVTSGTGLEGQYHTIDRRYPFTFVISKIGYKDYIIILETLDKKIEMTLTLEYTEPKIDSVDILDTTHINKNDGQLSINASSIYTPITYSINGIDYQTSNIFSNLSSDFYTVYIKDSKDNVASLSDIFIDYPRVVVDTQVVETYIPLSDYIPTYDVDEGPDSLIYRRVIHAQDNKCAICSIRNVWNKQTLYFNWHYVDGNNKNKAVTNLRLICSNCKSQFK